MGSTDMTPQERVRPALSRAMLDTPGGRDEMDSFVAQVVIAAAELAAIFDEPATEKLFTEMLKRLEQRVTDNPGSWVCDRASCGCWQSPQVGRGLGMRPLSSSIGSTRLTER